MAKKYYITTYGCQMNKSDSERIATFFEKHNWEKSSKIEEADLVVFNACSVRQSAIDRIYGKINNILKLKKRPKILITGCLLSSDIKKLKQKADYILSIRTLNSWAEFLKKKKYVAVLDLWEGKNREKDGCVEYFKTEPDYSSFPVAYIPISTGCNNFCSYCVVPYTRGPEVCRSVREIVSETEKAVEKGCKEIWLLGQNVNSYKYKENGRIVGFADLLRMVNDIEGDFWIRFTSPNPKDFSDELIEAMAECENVTPYLNLPLQSGDNEILKKMKRGYTAEKYKELVKKIRKKIPDIVLSTDIIVGFPGETKEQFENTKKLFEEIAFDMAYIAQYSPRPGTVAAKMKDDVPRTEKKRREKVLTEILKKNAKECNRKYIGKTIKVLPISFRNGFLYGKSFDYKSVKFKGKESLIGKFRDVQIEDASAWGLFGSQKVHDREIFENTVKNKEGSPSRSSGTPYK